MLEILGYMQKMRRLWKEVKGNIVIRFCICKDLFVYIRGVRLGGGEMKTKMCAELQLSAFYGNVAEGRRQLTKESVKRNKGRTSNRLSSKPGRTGC